MARPKKFPDEVMERAVRVALESERPIAHVAHDFVDGIAACLIHERILAGSVLTARVSKIIILSKVSRQQESLCDESAIAVATADRGWGSG